jgi:hypothetical protein
MFLNPSKITPSKHIKFFESNQKYTSLKTIKNSQQKLQEYKNYRLKNKKKKHLKLLKK